MTAAPKNKTDASSCEDTPSASAVPPARAKSIIFASCNSQYYYNPFWKIIRERNPTAFVWAGDSVYADDVKRIHWTKKDTAENARWWWSSFLENRRKVAYATPDCFRRIYAAQLKVPEYRQMLEDDNGRGKISMFGTIDDHDYGKNNGDKTYPFRCEAGIQFTNFLGLTNETSAMARRAAKGLGVYGVQVYDFSSTTHRLLTDTEAGLDPDVVPEQNDRHRSNDSDEETNQLVAVFVLDVRSNRTPWATTIPERFKVDPDGDFLGKDQWKWFETALGRSNASVNIIVSGVQVHAPWFYDGNRVENWSGFPKAQHRLYQTILRPNVRAPILMSGDVHMSQLMRKDCRRITTTTGNGANDEIRSLYEVTSSGMTHSHGSKTSFCGRPNRSRLCTFYPFRKLVQAVMTYSHVATPFTAILQSNRDGTVLESDASSRTKKRQQQQYSLDRNIAEFDFDWAERLVTVRILGDEGQTLLREDWTMAELTTAKDTMLGDKEFGVGQHRLESSLKTTLLKGHNEYVCVNYRGNANQVHMVFGLASTLGLMVSAGMVVPLFVCFCLLRALSRRLRPNRKHKKD